MPSAHVHNKRSWPLFVAFLVAGPVVSQPLCDVLLRPAFHYSTDGLTLIVQDSSTTYGVMADRTWTYGDGSGASIETAHQFTVPGVYEVCLSLSSPTIDCIVTYCRTVTVPLDDCGGQVDAYFSWYGSGTNALVLLDASLLADAGERFWEFGDGTTSDLATPAHTWLLPGPHFVALTRTSGDCAATYGTWVEVDGNATTCGPGLFADFVSYQAGNALAFEPAISADGVVPLLSIWSYGDGAMDTASTGYHTYEQAGAYQTCLLVGALIPPELDSCFTLVCHTFDILALVGMAEVGTAPLKVSPNPFSRELHIAAHREAVLMQVRLLDLSGRVIPTSVADAAGSAVMDADGLPSGVYLLEVRVGNALFHRRVVKVQE